LATLFTEAPEADEDSDLSEHENHDGLSLSYQVLQLLPRGRIISLTPISSGHFPLFANHCLAS
jgi:hypothetical protein